MKAIASREDEDEIIKAQRCPWLQEIEKSSKHTPKEHLSQLTAVNHF
jgi:hypothetical protein